MIKRLQGLAAARLLGQSFQSDGERYLRPMLAVADVFALAVHGYFFCVFWGWRIAALAWANLLGVVLYALSLRLLRTRRYGGAAGHRLGPFVRGPVWGGGDGRLLRRLFCAAGRRPDFGALRHGAPSDGGGGPVRGGGLLVPFGRPPRHPPAPRP